jgi:hypothetical protein
MDNVKNDVVHADKLESFEINTIKRSLVVEYRSSPLNLFGVSTESIIILALSICLTHPAFVLAIFKHSNVLQLVANSGPFIEIEPFKPP